MVLLLQHGASADATTKDKYTPLHIAAKEGHDEVAQVLLEHGASHDVTTKVSDWICEFWMGWRVSGLSPPKIVTEYVSSEWTEE